MKKTLVHLIAAGLSAALLASLWAPFSQTANAWIALVPLLLLTRSVAPRRAFFLGFLVGFISWAVQLSWMLRLTDHGGPWPLVIPGLLGLSAVLAFFIALFAGSSAALRRMAPSVPGPIRILLAVGADPILWCATETIRSTIFTGFAWNPLGLVCADLLPLAQIAAVGGAAATSALIIMANSAAATICERIWGAVTHTNPTDFRSRLWLTLESVIPLSILLGVFLWGNNRIRTYNLLPKDRLATIVSQYTETPCIFTGKRPVPIWEAAQETADLLPFLKPDLWLWPESAAEGYVFPLHSEPTIRLTRVAQQSGTPLLVGGTYRQGKDTWYNAALLFTADGLDQQQVYAKRHLVPFGEYIPFDTVFPALKKLAPTGISFTAGETLDVIRLPSGLVVGPLICFEDTVAAVARKSARKGAHLLVNMSNDAWYANTSEGEQHAKQAVLRAIETGLPIIRSTNFGVNTVVDAVGRESIIESFPTRIPVTETPFASYYLTAGDLVFGIPCILLLLMHLTFILLRTMKRPLSPKPTAALLVLLCLLPFTASAKHLLPIAEMATDDGNLNLAERTAHTLLSKVGITSEEYLRAEEVLIRSALARKEWDTALNRIEKCSELPAERRLALLLAATNGKQDFAHSLQLFSESKVDADSPWGVSALRMALEANLELGKNLQATALFSQIQSAKGADERVRAENALAWNTHFPNAQSREALLKSAEHADRGGPYLQCALALPKAFESVENTKPVFDLFDKLLALDGLSTAIEARLSLAAATLSKDPKTAVAYARRAKQTAREEDVLRKALDTLGTLLCADPLQADEGLSLLTEAVRLNPSAAEAPLIQLRIAETLQSLNRIPEALKAYDRYLESYDVPEFRVRVLHGIGRARLLADRPDEALSALCEAAEIATESVLKDELLLEAAEAAVKAKRPAYATKLYDQLLKRTPSSAIRIRLARCLEADGRLADARKTYEAIKNDPAAAENDIFIAVMRLGAMLCEEGRTSEAIAEYSLLFNSLKDSAARESVRMARARAYHSLGHLEKALNDFVALQNATEPETAAEARFFSVLTLYALGEDETARTLAQAYIATYPDSHRIPDVLLWLAKSDFNHGDYAAASAAFEDFTHRWPAESRVPQALHLAARAAYQDQAYARSVELIARLAKEYPDSAILPNARFLQAESLIELARHAEARDILDALIRRNPTASWIPQAYERKGDCLLMTATDDPTRISLAYQAYHEALTRVEADPDATLTLLYKIGRTQEKENRRDAAAETYTKLIYRVLAQPQAFSDSGYRALNKAIVQLRAIETARGNRAVFQTLYHRLKRANLIRE